MIDICYISYCWIINNPLPYKSILNKINMNTNINLIDKIVNKLFGNSLQIRYLNQFYKGLSKPINSKRNVLIYSGIGHMYCTPFEVLIYHLLGDRGFNVDYCIYDKNIPINEVITQASETKVGKN